MRPGPDYFAQLRVALQLLHGVPLSYSLSGLEMTDDPDWLQTLLQTLATTPDGPCVEQRVLYSNGAGLARARGAQLLDALVDFGLSWIELSRHHPLQAGNDAIMRFRPDEPIADAAIFARTAQRIAARLPVRLVCIVQRGGVDCADGVAQYIAWARRCGATQVIFRELSRLDDAYRNNGTWRYIAQHRIGMESLLADCMQQPWWSRWQADGMTEGTTSGICACAARTVWKWCSKVPTTRPCMHATPPATSTSWCSSPTAACARAGTRMPMCCGSRPMDELDQRSWWTPAPDEPSWALPEDLRAADPLGGRDCGWVNQMRPFVRHFSVPGAQVFDPFCGFGSTLLAAALEGRGAHGMEIDAARAQLARTRLQRHGVQAPVVVGTLVDTAPAAEIDLCLTNVPYFGCHWHGAALPGQLYASADYAGYLSGMRAVLHALRKRMRADGFGVAMAENIVVGGRVIPQAWDLGRILASLFTLREERVLCYRRPGAALAPAGTHSNRSHEYALIFQHCRARLDLQQAALLLQALRADGLPVQVHGSYARWLQAPESVPEGPADLDLILQAEQPLWDRLTAWLQAQGFALSLWGEPCRAPVALAAVRTHHYLRAERIGADGSRLQLDLQLPADEPPLP